MQELQRVLCEIYTMADYFEDSEDADLPLRVEGWLNVWEVDDAEEKTLFTDGHLPEPYWEPSFCVLLEDMAKFTLHGSEEIAAERVCYKQRRRVRLDGGKVEFERRWGYETLQSIKENAIQHCSHHKTHLDRSPHLDRSHLDRSHLHRSLLDKDIDSDAQSIASAESFFKTRTFQVRNESLPDSSLEKVSSPGEERRSSLPLVASVDDTSVMESSTSSTTSRLASFFSMKGFRSNLKRTKSVTKLDRKRSSSNVSESDTGSLVGSLKRSMSLGRLSRKRNKTPVHTEEQSFPCECVVQTAENTRTWSLISSRIRTSRSHESLLSNPSAMQAVDLTSRETEVKPVHPSVLSQDHCFHVATSHGSKYISCRTAEERDKWLSSLRRTIRPNQEQVRRSDSSLRLWIVEAKNVQPKKRYFCEILLDRKLYARTSSKLMADMLFWGEHFEFRDLPAVETITVNMFREADKKKKKDRNVLVCYINLAVEDISNKQFVEKWFSACSGTVGKTGKSESKNELPLIRMKVRHQTVHILPMDLYQDFTKFLMTDYHMMCEQLEPQMTVREKEEFATTLVHIMHKLGKARGFLCDIVMSEIDRLDNEHLTFRGNSIATKAMEAYMKLVGERYLHDTLGDFVRALVESEDDCEVDPTKVPNNVTLQCHQTSLEMYANMAWVKIISSYFYFPNELREVFTSFREHCRRRGKEDFSDNLISASIFLRFLCPAILSPSLFNLTQEYPQEKSARNLTLIAKTIQTLANFNKYGPKEEFMTFMNRFIEKEAPSMKNFLRKISSDESGNQFLTFDGYIDLGRELSQMQTMLEDVLARSPELSQQRLGGLSTILTALSDAMQDPTVGQHHHSRKSQIFYDNMPTTPVSAYSSSVHTGVHTSVHSAGVHSNVHSSVHTVKSAPSLPYQDTSPTEALKDMLRQCGESEEDLHAFAARAMRDTRETESAPPSLLLTPQKGSDELEEFSALYTSTSMTSSMSSSAYSTGLGANGRSEVADVSVSSQRMNQESLNETWSQIVNAADSVNGDYIDLIPFIDEEGQNSSLEMECPTTNGSQISISQLSTVASSGYQSFGYSQSSSPVEAGDVHDVTKSPVIQYPMQPLAFNNPLYRHNQMAQHHHHTHTRTHHHHQHHRYHLHMPAQDTHCTKEDSSSSISSGDEQLTIKHISPVKSEAKSTPSVDPLRKLSQLSSSSGSNESLNERSYLGAQVEKSASGGGDFSSSLGGVRFMLGRSSPAQAQSSPQTDQTAPPEVPPRPDRLPTRPAAYSGGGDANSSPVPPPRPVRTNSYCDTSATEQPNLGLRPYHLSHSMDFGCLQRQQADPLRRTATDSVIAKTSTPVHTHSGSLGSVRLFSREDSFSSMHSSHSQGSLNSRRLSPQSAVHMGISSVQRKLQEQERTKQEYEHEVHLLRQQLVEAQVRLQGAEMRLMDHEVETHHLMEEWQSRLAESEQRIRQQQAQKDDQMKSIIERLVTIEEELRKEQAEMQKVVHDKQHVIEVQEQRIRTLDSANVKLLQALAELKEHANNGSHREGRQSPTNGPGGGRNGMNGPVRPKLADLSGFKSSTC